MAGELTLTQQKDLLDSRTEAKPDSFQAQWGVVSEGLWQGLRDRTIEAKDNPLHTISEAGTAAGIGAVIVKGLAAGGGMRVAANAAGAVFGVLMGYDLHKRSKAIYDAYSTSHADIAGNALRKDAIAQNAGAGIFDYSLIFASGGAGMAATMKLSSRPALESSVKPVNDRLQQEQKEPLARRLMDTEKVAEDLVFSLDYQIPETAMSKISEALQKTNKEEFNDIVRKLAEKDRKMQGMDLTLLNWSEAAQRWDSAKLYHTDETMVSFTIAQYCDTVRKIAEVETSQNPKRTEDDIARYAWAIAYRNRITEQTALVPGRILVLPRV